MQQGFFKRLFAVLFVLSFVRATPSLAQTEYISDYLTGEIAQLEPVHGDVNFHDIMLVSAFDKNGKTIERLGDKKGKTLLLTLWHWDCLQCRRHMKQLAEVQENLGTDVLEVIAVNMDRTLFSRVRKTLDQRGLQSLVAYQDFNKNIPARLRNDPELPRPFGNEPRTLIIGPDGRVRAVANTRKDWNAPEAIAFLKALSAGKF